MVRRQEPAGLVTARDRLRELAAAQQEALSGFWQAVTRADQLHAELEVVEVEQRRHAGALAGLVGVAVTAELTGWSRTRVAEAHRAGRRPPAADGGVEARSLQAAS